MAARKWWISATRRAATFWVVSTGSAGSRHLQPARTEWRLALGVKRGFLIRFRFRQAVEFLAPVRHFPAIGAGDPPQRDARFGTAAPALRPGEGIGRDT